MKGRPKGIHVWSEGKYVGNIMVCLVTRTVKRMEKKLDSTLNFMRWVKSRNDTTYLDMLYRIQSILIREEKYEEAGRVKRIIDEELQTLNEKGE